MRSIQSIHLSSVVWIWMALKNQMACYRQFPFYATLDIFKMSEWPNDQFHGSIANSSRGCCRFFWWLSGQERVAEWRHLLYGLDTGDSHQIWKGAIRQTYAHTHTLSNLFLCHNTKYPHMFHNVRSTQQKEVIAENRGNYCTKSTTFHSTLWNHLLCAPSLPPPSHFSIKLSVVHNSKSGVNVG